MTTVRLGEIAVAHYGKALKENERNDAGPHLVFGSSGMVGRHDRALVFHPTIVIGRKGSVGTVTYAPSGAWPIDTVFYLEFLHPERVDLRYAYWVLTHASLGRRAITTSIPGLNRDELYRTRLSLPPLAEQRRIAALLDKADGIRRKRRESVRLLDEFLRSAFLELFGDPVRNEKGWRKVTIGELLPDRSLIVDGPFGSSLKPDSYVATGVRVIRNFNIRDDAFDGSAFKFVTQSKFDEVRRSEVRPGDVLISTKGTLGNVCLMPDLSGSSVLSATGTVRLRLPEESVLRRQFLVSQMVTTPYKCYLKRFEAGTNPKHLNLAGIRRLEVILPPIELQDRHCLLRSRVVALRNRQVLGPDATARLLDSLAQRAFRGEL